MVGPGSYSPKPSKPGCAQAEGLLMTVTLLQIDFKNQHGFTVECEEGRRLGFTGKQVIHPTQVLPAQVGILGRTVSPNHLIHQ